MFKILNGHYDINWEDFCTIDKERKNSQNTFIFETKKGLLQSDRSVDSLTEEMVIAKIVTDFKTLLDKYQIHQLFDTSEIY